MHSKHHTLSLALPDTLFLTCASAHTLRKGQRETGGLKNVIKSESIFNDSMDIGLIITSYS